MVKRAHWVLLAPAVALGSLGSLGSLGVLGDPALAQEAKPDDAVRRQAEELAEEASKKFGEVLQDQTPDAIGKAKPPSSPLSVADRERSLPLLLYWFDYSEHEYRGILRRLALEGAEKGWDPATIGWLKRSSQEFQAIMQRLARAGAPASKWDPVAEAHRRAVGDPTRPQDPRAGPSAPAAAPSAVAPGSAVAPDPAVAAADPQTGPQTGQGEAAGAARTAQAEATGPGDGRPAVAAPAAHEPGPGTIAPAEPAPTPGQATERAPVAADPALGPEKTETPPAHQAGEQPAGRPSPGALVQHEEEEEPSKPAAVIAEAKPLPVRPGEEEPSTAGPMPPAEPAGGGDASPQGDKKPAEAMPTKPAEEKPAEVTPTPDRLAMDPAAPRPDQAPDKPAASAPAQRHASKIAKPAEPKGRPAGDERCPSAGAQVALPGWYVVRTGDTLWAIAERHYGAGARYRTIFLANRERLKRGPDLILPCQQLYLPPQRRRGSSARR